MEEQESREFLRLVEWREGESESRRECVAAAGEAVELGQLHRAKERLRAFVGEIGELAETAVREDVLAYCDGQRKSEKCLEGGLRPEGLLRKIEVRIDKMLKTKRLKRNWGEEDLKILIWVVSKYADLRGLRDLEKDITADDWAFIASLIPGVTAEACMFKWLSIKKITLATHNWTRAESELLARIVNDRLGGGGVGAGSGGEIREWKEISQELYRANEDAAKVFRNAKQCREHWTCYLSPQLKKGPWQLYEDVKLLKFIRDNKGLKKWSEIARNFEGRTENALKNRYTLIIEKQKRLPRNKNKTELTLISEYLEKCYVDQFTAHVKVEPEEDQDSIYRDEDDARDYHEDKLPEVKREETLNCDTTESVITPLRVQKFSINDFESMNLNFFRHIQPGVIKSDGTFTKIPSASAPAPSAPAPSKLEDEGGKYGGGPFTVLPLRT